MRYRTVLFLAMMFPTVSTASSEVTNKEMTNAEPNKQAHNVQVVEYGDIAYLPKSTTAAQVIAFQDSQISSETTAQVDEILFDTASELKKGDIIIRLDCRNNQLQLEQARASQQATKALMENAEKLLKSAKTLRTNKNISEELFNQRTADAERLKAEYTGAKANTNIARLAVERCSIKAPFAGYLSERYVSKGDYVLPGTPLVRLIMSDKSEVNANINTLSYESFLNGQTHSFQYKGKRYPLKLERVLPVINNQYRTHTARLSFIENSAPIGSHGELSWYDNVKAIPANLIVERQGKHGVMTVNVGKASFIEIDDYVEGMPAKLTLAEDALIITSGRFGINDGDTVSLQKARNKDPDNNDPGKQH